MTLRPSIAVWDYDRTRPLLDGRVTVEGCAPTWLHDMPIETMFARALGQSEFDVSELSFSNFMALTARGACDYVGLPIFPSRSFRHGAWFVNPASGITRPEDLRGKRIGVREYSMTAAVVARGLLADEHGVAAGDVTWVMGDVEEVERSSIPLPSLPGITVEASDGLLLPMLLDGRIDALLAYKPPKLFQKGDARIARLFPDYEARERDYAHRTGIFPVMHLMGIRRSLAEAEPWLPMSLIAAFTAAKDLALSDLAIVQALKVALPWTTAELERTRAALGEDYWPYGIARNRKALSALARWHHAQGLSPRELTVEELFFRTTLGS
ncbi:substrate-binding domain-containing protein [Falsiroseomonas selenitidurans]|uniref:ABC transporter substrate-binding protein n=1 Tax=Falsiroseomonas selenitidurans TaxID=2716335 RepID=A0ABX1EDD8_9PROT|nr:ABC transporter substrate-binding protein [Falsiroseomonas selenitidurans]NKC33547.1 ABC transporter substrate-binding protein [Falsiroseomonas selenitidurans]